MSENGRMQLKLAAMGLMLAGAGVLTYLFHARLGVGRVFTHLFYVPIVLAAIWWGRRGVLAAGLLGAMLVLSSALLKKGGEALGADVLRAGMFLAVSVAAAALSGKLTDRTRRLGALAARLASVEERHRRQVAGELHDGVGQKLAVAKLRLGAARRGCEPAEIAARMDEVLGLLDQAIEETRSLTFELCPPMLYDVGLAPAVRWLAERIQRVHGLSVEVRDDGQPKPLDQESAILLFRAVQELLANVVKHARAGRAEVHLRADRGGVVVAVADDGAGMGDGQPPAGREGGFGLFSLRERLLHAGGTLEISSAAGQGTRAEVFLPLQC